MYGRDIDIAIAGGGLAGAPTARAARRPELRLLVVNRGETFGDNLAWSRFASDVPAQDAWLIEPPLAALSSLSKGGRPLAPPGGTT